MPTAMHDKAWRRRALLGCTVPADEDIVTDTKHLSDREGTS